YRQIRRPRRAFAPTAADVMERRLSLSTTQMLLPSLTPPPAQMLLPSLRPINPVIRVGLNPQPLPPRIFSVRGPG
ncbi:MAG: hypothetical protein AB7I30_10400, partial [Isosphaeraceae bacterium]